jgi:hypothetical protein
VRTPIESLTAVRDPLAPMGKALGHPRSHVGHSHREHLLLRPHVLAVLACERARGEDLVGKADQEDSDRRIEQQQRVPAARNRYAQLGEAARNAPDHCNAPLLEVEPPGKPDRDDDNEQRRGEAAGDEPQEDQDSKRGRADRQGEPARVAELAHDLA